MRNTLSYLFAVVILVGAGAGVMFNAAYANGQSTCPQDDGWTKIDSDDLSLYPVDGATDYCFKFGSDNSRGCDGGLSSTWPPDPEEFPNPCGLSHWSYFVEESDDPTATLEPTPTPTDTPEPTPTPTDEPQPTPTPTDEDCGGECDPTEVPTPTPTDPPTLEPTPTATELPQTGDGGSTEAWLCWGENVYCAHNGVDGSEGELWVFLYPGATITFRGQSYTVESIYKVTPDMVQSLDDAVNYDIVLVTCSNYVGGVWVNRIIVFANLSE